MPFNIEAPRIYSKETPREILAEDFKKLKGELPIHGGWGYTRDGAVILEKEDFCSFYDVERIFVEKRIYEELIIFAPKEKKCSGINWQMLIQKFQCFEDKKYDLLSYEVTAFLDSDREKLKNDYETNFDSASAEWFKAHEEDRNNKMLTYNTEYWFDITNVFGQSFIPAAVKKTF